MNMEKKKEINDFNELIKKATDGDKESCEKIIQMYRPLIVKESIVLKKFDEDLYQELIEIVLICIKNYKI